MVLISFLDPSNGRQALGDINYVDPFPVYIFCWR